MEFYEKLGIIRKSKHITQNEMAERCGVCRSAISAMEHGKRPMHADVLIQYCLRLELSVDSILQLDLNETPKVNLKLLHLLEQMSPDEQLELLDIAQILMLNRKKKKLTL